MGAQSETKGVGQMVSEVLQGQHSLVTQNLKRF